MKLKAYLAEHKIKVQEFAAQVGCDRQTIYSYVRGKKKPGDENMIKIMKLTNGDVTANDFYKMPKLKSTISLNETNLNVN